MINFVEQYCQQHQLKKALEDIRPRLHRTAWSWCQDSDLAEDLVQDSISKALKNLKSLTDIDRFEPWVFKILRNTWIDFCRTKKDNVSLDDTEELSISDSPEKLLERENTVIKVRKMVSMLPEKQKQVVTLVDLAECSYAETAEILEIPIGTVMSRLCRARKLLVTILEKEQQKQPILKRVI